MNFEKTYKGTKRWLKNLGYAGLMASMLGSSVPGQLVDAKEYEQVKPKNQVVKEVEDKSQFTTVDNVYIGEAGDGDDDKEIVMLDNREDGLMFKIYPIGEEEPFDVIYDIDHDSPKPNKYIDGLSLSAYQNSDDSVSFKLNLRGDPELTEEMKEEVKRMVEATGKYFTKFAFYIDGDKSRDTGQDTKTLGIDYDLTAEFKSDGWSSQIMGPYGKETLPGETSCNVEGNEITMTVNLDDIDTDESFDFAFGSFLFPLLGKSTEGWPNDHAPNTAESRTGTLTIDSDLEDRGKGDFSKIYSLSENVEDVEFKEVNGKQGILLDTEGEDIFLSGE